MVRKEEKWKRLVAGHSGYSLSRPILRPLPLLLALSPFPGRHRMRVGPEVLAAPPGGLLDLGEHAPFLSYCTYRQASPLATSTRFT